MVAYRNAGMNGGLGRDLDAMLCKAKVREKPMFGTTEHAFLWRGETRLASQTSTTYWPPRIVKNEGHWPLSSDFWDKKSNP